MYAGGWCRGGTNSLRVGVSGKAFDDGEGYPSFWGAGGCVLVGVPCTGLTGA